jgi:MSHA biogenesis protein MshK
MADRLMPVFRATILLALYTLTLGVRAQTALSDPTRPPLAFSSPTTDAGPLAGPVLQSVKIPKKGKPLAVIGGQQVRLGEFYGDSRLIRLTEREAVLQGPAGTERLMLTPGIEKTNIITKSPAAKRAQSGGKP